MLMLLPTLAFANPTWPKVTCSDSDVPLFQSEEVLDLTFKGTFPVNAEQLPAEIDYVHPTNRIEKVIPVKVVQRGKTRGWSCPFRPVRIIWNENKELLQETPFENVRGTDMKLVAHCRYTAGTIEENEEANDVIVKEYTVYKILKAFGLPVHNVRLTKIQYADKENKPTVEGYGFFLESNSLVAHRCGLTHAKPEEIPVVAGASMNKMIYIPYLFSRLISDARDFIVESGHNSEPFYDANKATQLVVPYDFNDSGQVNSGIAPYWNFTPDLETWFGRLRKGPFTRDSYEVQLTPEEQKTWKTGIAEMAKILIPKKKQVLKAIDEAPLAEKSAEQFRKHIDDLMEHFEKIADGK